ncbi:hypothetical protein DW970_07825 [Clostridium sp. AM48-13]|uniref:DUF6978 family protein n=1 Tax=Clostridium TaxID=1485 RepID=UPI000E4A3C98|nr:hypothetical protein [Clostridium fessum]RHQ18729.1 hypothetical protein DW970_07825 [Clostridium sp. AM48-13]
MEPLTKEEATRLIKLTKQSLIDILSSPDPGANVEFDASHEDTGDLFTVKIYRGKINKNKYNYGARISKNGIILLELHINAGNIHVNPNGQKITGSHWHYYTQENGIKNAFPADDLDSNDFVKNTLLFLEEFHIVNTPTINHQIDLF